MKDDLENITWLIENGGDISIGRCDPVRCAATACDEPGQIAALVKKPNESLMDLLKRLDESIEIAWEEERYIDEINH